jgi:hypothetical protein
MPCCGISCLLDILPILWHFLFYREGNRLADKLANLDLVSNDFIWYDIVARHALELYNHNRFLSKQKKTIIG